MSEVGLGSFLKRQERNKYNYLSKQKQNQTSCKNSNIKPQYQTQTKPSYQYIKEEDPQKKSYLSSGYNVRKRIRETKLNKKLNQYL